MRTVPDFDAETHTYRISGKVVPSVTEVLSVLGAYKGVSLEAMEQAGERGKMVHRACEYLDKGTLDWETLDDSLLGYVEAWERFKTTTKAKVFQIEERVAHRALGYAGTFDREMQLTYRIPGQEREVRRRALLDLKATAAFVPTVGPQTAAYMEAYNAGTPEAKKIKHRLAVRLLPNRTYRLHILNDRSDLTVFRSALAIYKWRKYHGFS